MILQNYNQFGDNRNWVNSQLVKTKNKAHVGFFKAIDNGVVLILCLHNDRLRLHINTTKTWHDLTHVHSYSQKGRSSALKLRSPDHAAHEAVECVDSQADEQISGDITAYEREHSDFLLFVFNLRRNTEQQMNLLELFRANEP